MPVKPTENVIKDCFNAASRTVGKLGAVDDISRYILAMLEECGRLGIKNYSLSPNQLGRCNGDWFEYAIENVLKNFFRGDEFKAYPGRGHHIKEVRGFEKVSWIPMPDAIIKNTEDLRAVLSLKWGMRHDRMYEVGYEAYAIKDWCARNRMRSPKMFLVTDDHFSGYESRLRTMHECPVVDDIYYVQAARLGGSLKSYIKPMPILISDLKGILDQKTDG